MPPCQSFMTTASGRSFDFSGRLLAFTKSFVCSNNIEMIVCSFMVQVMVVPNVLLVLVVTLVVVASIETVVHSADLVTPLIILQISLSSFLLNQSSHGERMVSWKLLCLTENMNKVVDEENVG